MNRRGAGVVALVSAVCGACMIDLPPPLEGSGGDGGAAAGATSSASAGATAGAGGAAGGSGGLLEACAPQSCQGAACAPEIVATVPGAQFRALAIDDESVYVANDDNNKLYRFDKARHRAGEDPVELIGSTGAENVTDLVVDGTAVYFASSVGIYRFEKPGGAPVPANAIALPFKNGRAWRMVLDQDTLFWVRFQAPSDPPVPEDCLFSAATATPGGDGTPLEAGISCKDLAMDESWLYLMANEGRTIARIPKAGGAFETVLSGSAQHNAIEVDDTLIYSTTTGTTVERLGKAPPHDVEQPLILQKPYDVVRALGTAPSMLYFTNELNGGFIHGVVGNEYFKVAENGADDRPDRLAVDDQHVYWTVSDAWLLRAARCPAK